MTSHGQCAFSSNQRFQSFFIQTLLIDAHLVFPGSALTPDQDSLHLGWHGDPVTRLSLTSPSSWPLITCSCPRRAWWCRALAPPPRVWPSRPSYCSCTGQHGHHGHQGILSALTGSYRDSGSLSPQWGRTCFSGRGCACSSHPFPGACSPCPPGRKWRTITITVPQCMFTNLYNLLLSLWHILFGI